MKQYLQDIINSIEEAELVVVGLGEEWNISPAVQSSEAYGRIIEDLKKKPEYQWILPYVYYKMTDESLMQAYQTLFSMLQGKNYFVVATTVNRSFVPFAKEGRVVMPCGNDAFLLDKSLICCADATVKATDVCGKQAQNELSLGMEYSNFLRSLESYIKGEILLDDVSFIRNSTGEIVPFNSVYAAGYREEGYLSDWSRYMSWLQGTMNRKTCLLELGAGLQFPSVFRFPFEKMAYFNRKAICYRVHRSLYQLTEEMAERSKSVPMHSVELFQDSCIL